MRSCQMCIRDSLLPVLGEDDGGRGVVEEGQRAGGWCPDLGGVLAAGKDFVLLQTVGLSLIHI